jgi:hypothetical protein
MASAAGLPNQKSYLGAQGVDRVAEQGNIPDRHGATGCAAVIVSRYEADMSALSTIRHSTGAKRPPVR